MNSISDMELLLLAVNYAGRIEGRIRLQKITYILKEQWKIDFGYRFIPYMYGPYCPRLQDDVNVLSRSGFMRVERVNTIYIYEITSKGKETARQIEKRYSVENAKKLRERVEWLKESDTDELVKWSKKLMEEKMGPNIWF